MGLGRVLAFGVSHEPTVLRCPECAGLDIVPASADDRIVFKLLQTAPALPPGPRSPDLGPGTSPGRIEHAEGEMLGPTPGS
jgi:hypothetical protein